MKIRRKKPRVSSQISNVGWLMATTAMFHFCSYVPAWAVEAKSKEKDVTEPDPFGKGMAPSQDVSRDRGQLAQSREKWRALHAMLDSPQQQATKQKMVARLGDDAQQTVNFDIPPQFLASALKLFSEQADLQFAYTTEELEGVQASGVSGAHTPEAALRLLLDGTGMSYRVTGDSTITVEKVGGSSNALMQGGLLSQSSSGSGGVSEARVPTEAKEKVGQKPIRVPEVVVKDVVERDEGYKADMATGSTRTALPIDETPSSIGVVTQDIIRDTLSLRQNDALENVSGVSRNNTRLGRGEGFNIRGFEVGSFDGSFNALRSNGLPIDSAFALDSALIDRYEIIKGPASIVGGASSPGGVVNRITKKPQNTNFATSQFQAGSYNLYRGVVDANGVLPQNPDVRGRIIFAVEDGGNFVDQVDVRQYTVAPSLEMSLFGGAGTLLFTGHYQHFNGSSYVGFPLLDNGKVPDIPRTRNIGGGTDNGASLTYEGQNYELHYNHEFVNNLKLSMKGKYSRSDVSDKILYSYVYGGGGLPLNGDTYIYSGLRKNEFETYAGEAFLSKEFEALGQQHEVLLGVDHRDMTLRFFAGLYISGADNIFNPPTTFKRPRVTF
ncbi:MAG: TonB-dependent receptor [Nitrospirales bacterium]|nr:TonB-dependent receptor [Nitrospirales bacterium]